MATLSEGLSSYRTTQANGHAGLLSKLQIGTSLYDIKDPAVEQLATLVESRLSELEGKSWTAVTKDANAAKFATAVTQGTDGSISVTYGTIRDAALTDTSTTNQVVKGIAQTVDGVVSATMGQVAADEVAFTPGTDFDSTSTNVQAAIEDALAQAMALKGTSSDQSSAETIAGAKAYADAAVEALAGQDWGENAKKVQEIIAELEDSENGNAWLTAIDKLAGMSIAGKTATAEDAVEYNEELSGAIKPGTELTAAQVSAVNAVSGISKTYAEGDEITSADAARYNATLDGAIAAGATYTDTNVTVKEYVDAKVAAAESAASGGITDLDMIVYAADGAQGQTGAAATSAYSSDTTHKVVIKLTEEDGKVTGIDLKTNDIASATGLAALDAAAVKSVNGQTGNSVTLYAGDVALSSSDNTTVAAKLTTLDTTKANAAYISSGSINNWAVPTYSSETLTWNNTATTVLVPGSGNLTNS